METYRLIPGWVNGHCLIGNEGVYIRETLPCNIKIHCTVCQEGWEVHAKDFTVFEKEYLVNVDPTPIKSHCPGGNVEDIESSLKESAA